MTGSDKLLIVLRQRDVKTTVQKTFRKNGIEFRFTIDLSDDGFIDYEIWDLVKDYRITKGFSFNWKASDMIEIIDQYSNKYKGV